MADFPIFVHSHGLVHPDKSNILNRNMKTMFELLIILKKEDLHKNVENITAQFISDRKKNNIFFTKMCITFSGYLWNFFLF